MPNITRWRIYSIYCKKADIKENGYTSQVYILNNKTGELKQITSINSVGAYVWEDENTILFPALRNEKVKEAVKTVSNA